MTSFGSLNNHLKLLVAGMLCSLLIYVTQSQVTFFDTTPLYFSPNSITPIGLREVARIELHQQDWYIIDVRNPSSFKTGRMPGAHNLTDLNIQSIAKASLPFQSISVLIYGDDSTQGAPYLLAQKLLFLKFKAVVVYVDGWKQWSLLSLPTEKG